MELDDVADVETPLGRRLGGPGRRPTSSLRPTSGLSDRQCGPVPHLLPSLSECLGLSLSTWEPRMGHLRLYTSAQRQLAILPHYTSKAEYHRATSRVDIASLFLICKTCC